MRFKKLRTRMIAHIVWIVTAVTVITFFVVYKAEQKTLRSHLIEDVTVFSETIENVLFETMEKHEGLKAMPSLLEKSAQLKHIKTIRVLKPDGVIAFSSNPDEPGNKLTHDLLTHFISGEADSTVTQLTDKQEITVVKLRKFKNREYCQQCHDKSQKLAGVLWVETTSGMDTLKSSFYALCWIALAVIILLSFATIILFIRSVDLPVKSLQESMRALEKGDFSTRVQISSEDELGRLGQGMNTLAEKLEKAKNQLEEHQRQEALQTEAMAKIGKLSAGLAHEIKNPISGIVFAVNSILREIDPDDSKKEIFEEIVKQANRVEQNLESLLNFAKQSRLECTATKINHLIERILLFMSKQPDMKLIKSESHLDPNLPEVFVDPKQIEQVLLNLIINAVQAMPNGGILTVTTSYNEERNRVYITVQDTGNGIPQEFKDKIFQPFYTTKEKGVGLGLTLCKEIITRHHGSISFESDPETGTIFSVEIPINNNKLDEI